MVTPSTFPLTAAALGNTITFYVRASTDYATPLDFTCYWNMEINGQIDVVPQ
jgi:hypothetical protein